MTLRIGILGPTSLTVDGVDLPLKAAKPRTLLAALALRPNTVWSVANLIDVLWPEGPPRRAEAALQVYVSQLRKLLPPDRIVTSPPGYLLRVDASELDEALFDELREQARERSSAGSAKAAAGVLQQALMLWRGEALADVDSDALAGDRARLNEARLTAVDERFEELLAAGEQETVVGELERFVSEHPYRERSWAQLMIALYRQGRQADALDAFQRARTVLLDELGIEPSPLLRAVEEAVLLQLPELDGGRLAATPARHNLPVVASLIGRNTALVELVDAITRRRVVSLVGAGGVGKTTLAVAVAHAVVDRFAGGAWFAGLAEVRSELSLAHEIAAVVGNVDPSDDPVAALVSALGATPTLLVVDNCEHLRAGVAAFLTELLAALPGLTVLVTSREPVGLADETVWRVPSLDVPDSDAPDVVRRADSVRLFVDRAATARGAFSISAENAAAVAAICRELDGIPFAIELAAARTPTMSTRQIARRLGQRLDLLRGEGTLDRQATLRAMVAWSVDLLTEDEQALFAALAVFRGGCTLDAAEAVCYSLPVADVFDGLETFVEKSLLNSTPDDDAAVTRYVLPETVRAFAAERLQEAKFATQARDAHTAWMADFAAAQGPALRGPRYGEATATVAAEVGNVRAALDWALEHDPRAAAAIVADLRHFWGQLRYRVEGAGWAARVYEDAEAVTPAIVRCQTLAATTDAELEAAVAAARQLRDNHVLGEVLVDRAHAQLRANDRALSETLDEAEALELPDDLAAARDYHRGKAMLLDGKPLDAVDAIRGAIARAARAGYAELVEMISLECRTLWPALGQAAPDESTAALDAIPEIAASSNTIGGFGERAYALWFAGDLVGAEGVMRRMIELAERDGEDWQKSAALADLAEIVTLLGRGEEGRELGVDAIACATDNDTMFNSLCMQARAAWCDARVDDLAEVVEALGDVFDELLDGNRAVMLTYAAALCLLRGDHDSALNTIEEAVALVAGFVPPNRRLLRAIVHQASGQATAPDMYCALVDLPIPNRTQWPEALELAAVLAAEAGDDALARRAVDAATTERMAMRMVVTGGARALHELALASVGYPPPGTTSGDPPPTPRPASPEVGETDPASVLAAVRSLVARS